MSAGQQTGNERHVDGREPLTLPPGLTTFGWRWCKYRPDGRCLIDGVELPPLPALERRAVAITIGGCLVRERAPYARMGYSEWQQHKEDFPGRLDVTVKPEGPCLRYAVSFVEAGDEERPLNFTTGYHSAAHALAWVVAVAQEHHADACTELLEHTGGLA